ncbi:hypothetical protein [Aliikangiella sp. IMCC44359]|uniref:hypothetical protein n=1 Tax=Aliikangiella sp. IMCC44359 TaxID=3459125 RepID=UPI00403AEE68
MKIYNVKPDANYRLLFPEETVYKSDLWEFKCQPLAGRLPLHFKAQFSDRDDAPLPDIAWIGMSTFAFRRDVADELAHILEPSGELLPFTVDGEQWYCFNVLSHSDNAVDIENSSFEIDDGETRFGLKKPCFIEANLPKTSLFKIKEDNYTNILCVDRREPEEEVLNNFFCAIAAHKFTGIKFTETLI